MAEQLLQGGPRQRGQPLFEHGVAAVAEGQLRNQRGEVQTDKLTLQPAGQRGVLLGKSGGNKPHGLALSERGRVGFLSGV